jgi:hypothetical protein
MPNSCSEAHFAAQKAEDIQFFQEFGNRKTAEKQSLNPSFGWNSLVLASLLQSCKR